MADKKVTTSLCELPTEIQHLIVLNLHPSAAIALKRTNRWFHTHISLHRLGRPEVFRFLTEHENLPKFSKNFHQGKRTSSLGYACFTCLTIKPATNFTEDQITGHYGKYATFNETPARLNSIRRSCIDCSLMKKAFYPGQVLRMADGETLNLFCPACQNLQAYFCDDCLFCTAMRNADEVQWRW